MKRLLLVFILFVVALATPSLLCAKQKVLYLSYHDENFKENVPERVYNGQYFSITLKTLSTIKQYDKLKYSLRGAKGVRLQNHVPHRTKRGAYVLDTFDFLATSSHIRLPDFTATLGHEKSTLKGETIEGVTLNPDQKFSGLLADDLEITAINAKKYDNKHNILTFDADVKHSNIKAFKLNNANEQGFESAKQGIDKASMTYYAVIDKKYDTLVFTYFNLIKERYMKVKIPVDVIDDSVSTQSDLKPTENRHHLIKIGIAAAIILFALILLLVYRQWWLLLFILIPGLYIAYESTPSEEICVKADTPLYLLPINNATVFDVLPAQGIFEVKHSVKGYKQITYNKKIGWINEDNICSN